jgi:hypothetical protein
MRNSRARLGVTIGLTALLLGISAASHAESIVQALKVFTSVAAGLVPASGGGTTNFLRADGGWAAPAGGVAKIASGSQALNTAAIASGTCDTVVSATATGVLTTDTASASFNADPSGVTGYLPSTAGMLTILVYPSANLVNFKVCNNTTSSVTPGAITLNWQVLR